MGWNLYFTLLLFWFYVRKLTVLSYLVNCLFIWGTSQLLASKHTRLVSVWLQFYSASELFILTDSADRTEAFTQSVDDFSLRQGAVHTFILSILVCVCLLFQQPSTRHLIDKLITSVFKIYVSICFHSTFIIDCISSVFPLFSCKYHIQVIIYLTLHYSALISVSLCIF